MVGRTFVKTSTRVFHASWPWLLLAVLTLPAIWHWLHVPDDLDVEFPTVYRRTYSAYPPPAYRLAEPGDPVGRISILCPGARGGLAGSGLVALPPFGQAPAWPAALALSLAALWHGSTPGPTFDGWHGLGW